MTKKFLAAWRRSLKLCRPKQSSRRAFSRSGGVEACEGKALVQVVERFLVDEVCEACFEGFLREEFCRFGFGCVAARLPR